MSRWVERQIADVKSRLERMDIPEDLIGQFAKYKMNPVAFAEEVLGIIKIPEYQKQFMMDVAQYERVAWVAGHASGKSFAMALLLIWFMLCYPESRSIVTSATFERQVGRVIFAKMKTLIAKAPVWIPINVFAIRAYVGNNQEWGVEGVPSANPAGYAGFHAASMLVLVDEAKAVSKEAFEELLSNLASAVDTPRLVLVSTAGPAQGFFYERFSDKHAGKWKTHRTPSTISPFARGYAERMAEECLGVEDPVYRMRVMAEFVEDVEGQLIPLTMITAAVGRTFDDDVDDKASLALGVDLARFGDDRSVMCFRRGRTVAGFEVWSKFDLMSSAARVSTALNLQGGKAGIDTAGLGSGCFDRLRQLGHRDVVSVNVAERARKPDVFLNLRAEVGWKLRETFERGDISIPDDPALISELASLRYHYDGSGRIQLERKEVAKSRLGRSPDLADALMLSYAVEGKAKPIVIAPVPTNELSQANQWRIENEDGSGGRYGDFRPPR